MLNFFKGWRRKAGVVALGLACVFAGGWVRSMHVEDHFWISLAPLGCGWSSSVDGSLNCTITSRKLNYSYAGWSANRWSRPVIKIGRAAYADPNDGWWLDKDGYVVTEGGVRIGGQVDERFCWMETPPRSDVKLPPLNTDCIDLYGNRTKSSSPPPDIEFHIVIPYWPIVLPLTLLSAWLLLGKLRSAAPKTTESAPTEGA